jgi:hypothetical protein
VFKGKNSLRCALVMLICLNNSRDILPMFSWERWDFEESWERAGRALFGDSEFIGEFPRESTVICPVQKKQKVEVSAKVASCSSQGLFSTEDISEGISVDDLGLVTASPFAYEDSEAFQLQTYAASSREERFLELWAKHGNTLEITCDFLFGNEPQLRDCLQRALIQTGLAENFTIKACNFLVPVLKMDLFNFLFEKIFAADQVFLNVLQSDAQRGYSAPGQKHWYLLFGVFARCMSRSREETKVRVYEIVDVDGKIACACDIALRVIEHFKQSFFWEGDRFAENAEPSIREFVTCYFASQPYLRVKSSDIASAPHEIEALNILQLLIDNDDMRREVTEGLMQTLIDFCTNVAGATLPISV